MTRTAKTRAAKPPSMEALAGKLWQALEAAAELLDHEDPSVRLKAVAAVASTGSVYGKIQGDAVKEQRRSENPFLNENPFAALLD